MRAQTLAPDEVLVIDDGSQDATAEIASRYAGVTVIRHERNRGLGAARNTGFGAARHELVAALDADCVPEPGWLARLVPHLNDPDVVGAGGRLIESIGRTAADRWRCAHMRQERGESLLGDPDFLFGCNNIFRKSAVLEIGGFNEAMRTAAEDVDISRRLRSRNWRLVYEPGARVTHLRHDTVMSVLDASWRWWHYGASICSPRASVWFVIARSVYIHFRYTFLNLANEDLRAWRFELLGVDLLGLAYYPYRDFRRWREAHFSAKPEVISS